MAGGRGREHSRTCRNYLVRAIFRCSLPEAMGISSSQEVNGWSVDGHPEKPELQPKLNLKAPLSVFD